MTTLAAALWSLALAWHPTPRADTVRSVFSQDEQRALGSAIATVVPRLHALSLSRDSLAPIIGRCYADYVRALPFAETRTTTSSDKWQKANALFVESINYSVLLQVTSYLYDRGTYEAIRARLDSVDPGHSAGKRFLLVLADRFIAQIPLAPAQFDARIRIAQSYMAIKPGHGNEFMSGIELSPAAAQIFDAVGRFLLLRAAQSINAAGEAAWTPFRTKALSDARIFVPRGSSDFEKLTASVKGQDYAYVLDRLKSRVTSASTSRRAELAAVDNEVWSVEDVHAWPDSTFRLYKLKGSHHSDAGTILWLSRRDSSGLADYVTADSGDKIDLRQLGASRGRGRLIAATTANYSTPERRPIGLSSVRGQMRNYYYDPGLDGLVMISEDGRIVIGDLRDGIDIGGRTAFPRSSFVDLVDLWTWSADKGMSLFQTHCLMLEGSPRIDPRNAPFDLKERRLLVTTPDGAAAIVTLPVTPRSWDLVGALQVVVKVFAENFHAWPISVANLDVGRYDILTILGDDGRVRSQTKKPVSEAPNLLLFYAR